MKVDKQTRNLLLSVVIMTVVLTLIIGISQIYAPAQSKNVSQSNVGDESGKTLVSGGSVWMGDTLDVCTSEYQSAHPDEARCPKSASTPNTVPRYYDYFGSGCYEFGAYKADMSNNMILNATTDKDPKVNKMLTTMFGCTPQDTNSFVSIAYSRILPGEKARCHPGYQAAYTAAVSGSPTVYVPVAAGQPVKVPVTDYDIGGGYEGMVLWADSDSLTFHIGAHEVYGIIRGTGVVGHGNDNGGYWIHLSNIDVNPDIIAAYTSAPSDRSRMPTFRSGDILGTARSGGVRLAISDTGSLIDPRDMRMWEPSATRCAGGGGSIPTATAVPTGGPTATRVPTTTTGPGTPTSSPPPNATPTSIPSLTPAPTTTTAPGTPTSTPAPTPLPTSSTQCNNLPDCGSGASCELYPNTECRTCTTDRISCKTSGSQRGCCRPTPSPTPTPIPTPTPTPDVQLCDGIRVNGNPGEKYDVLIVPSRFSDHAAFKSQAQRMVDAFYRTNIPEHLKQRINFVGYNKLDIDYQVTESLDDEGDVSHSFNHQIARDQKSSCGADLVVVVHNTDKLEGYSWLYTDLIFITDGAVNIVETVLAHELGHAIAGLGDEYEYKNQNIIGATTQPNCSNESTCGKWNAYSSDVKCLPTCGYNAWYRPSEDSTMRFNTTEFNKPSLLEWERMLSAYR